MDEHELTTDNMTNRCNDSMERVEVKIINDKQTMFYGMDSYRVYYSAFGDTNDTDNNVLPFVEDIHHQKEVEVNEAYIGELYNYIGAKVVFPVINIYQF